MNKLTFISDENLKNHVAETIKHYGECLKSYDLKKFNNNIVDPNLKLILDSKIINR